jgi:hypothetical protein
VKARVAASALLAAGLVLGTAGCTFLTPVATMNHYDPSDGVSANVGNLQLRNVFVISPKGEDANLVGAIINTGTSTEEVQLQYETHSGGSAALAQAVIKIKGGQVISYGNPGVKQVVLDNTGVKPGALLKVFVQYGNTTGKNVLLPVLTGSQAAYKNLKPSPTPTPTETPTPTPTSTATTN